MQRRAGDRLDARGAGERHALPEDDRHAALGRERRRLGREPRLADAAFALEKPQAAAAGARPVERLDQRPDHVFTPHQLAAIEIHRWAPRHRRATGLAEVRRQGRRRDVGVAETLPAGLPQEREDEVVEPRRYVRHARRRRNRRVLEVRPEHGPRIGVDKRRSAGDGLVEHAAERVEVGPCVHPLAADLLRRHVRHGAREHPADRQHLPPGASAPAREEAEVDEHGCARRSEVDVSRFEIAVHDPALVDVGERLTEMRERHEERRALRRVLAGSRRQAIAQREAFEQLHREPRQPDV
jgi:hypothetical protein